MAYSVTVAARMALSPSFSLSNTLLVPSLSNKLLYIGQATKELNCCALMNLSFYMFLDIITKKIIGHGTKQRGLYYMDDFDLSWANIMHRTNNKERHIWL